MEIQPGTDLISGLPDSIIENILSLLPYKDATKTCILSSNWRYKWANPSQLVFDAERENCTLNSLKSRILRTLVRHKGPIHTFKLSDPELVSCGKTDAWFDCLVKRGIKELFIEVGFDPFWVPSRLYSCRKLTHLELFRCKLCSPPPDFKGFLCLRSLILQHVKVDSEAIQRLVTESRILERLKLGFSGGSELMIRAPNLKYFYVRGRFREIRLDAPLLTEIYVGLPEYGLTGEQLQPESSVVCNYTKLLGSLSNLEKLIAHEGVTKYLSIGILSCRHFLAFHRLKVINLCEVNFEGAKGSLVVFRLITNAPNLHELQISCCCYASEPPIAYSWDSERLRTRIFNQLRVFRMVGFRGVLQEMKFVEFLLKTSPLLEAMTIVAMSRSLTNHRTLKVRAKLRAKVQRYQRASPNAKISFL